MSTFKTFEEIEAWKESRLLVRKVRAICKRARLNHDYSFIDQITAAARSISANIAEGFQALTFPEFITFLGYSKRSAGEVKSHLYDALDENYVSKEEFADMSQQSEKICKMIAGLIHYLQTLDQKQKRTHVSKPTNQLTN